MSLEDFIDDLGLWGGRTGQRALTNAQTAVKLVEAQQRLRGEDLAEADATRLVETLVGMQRVAAGVGAGKGGPGGKGGTAPSPVVARVKRGTGQGGRWRCRRGRG